MPFITYTRADVISQTTFADTKNYRAQIDELLEQAPLANQKLNEFMQRLSNTINNTSGKPIAYSRAPIKTRDRIASKCGITDWEHPETDVVADKSPLLVKDIARATIVFSTVAQMLAFRDFIYTTDEFKALKDKHFLAVKDLWSQGVVDQYKDIKFFLQVKINFRNQVIPHIVELQLNVGQMSRGKQYGHAFYNLSRLGMLEGKPAFIHDNSNCIITVPGSIKGKIGNKLRTALVECRKLCEQDPEVLLAINILSKMLDTKLRQARNAPAALREQAKNMHPYDFLNGTTPLVIRCGPYDPSNQPHQDSDAAQAWAIARLSRFVWSYFTECQNRPGITGLADTVAFG